MTERSVMIRAHHIGAKEILDAAVADGIPVTEFSVVTPDRVDFQLDTAEEVRRWVDWRGLTYERVPLKGGTEVLHRATGVVYDVPIKVYATVPVLCPECAHPAISHRQVGCQEIVGDKHSPRSQRSCACRHANQGSVLAEVARLRSQDSHAQAMAVAR